LEQFGMGARRFMIGFSKKVLIADSVAGIADAAFGLPAPHTGDAWIGVLAYAVQIFFDFSGYSDMAIGLGRMIGFRFPENFDRPYTARSITEFWRRWHMSLSRWLRDYLYIPLGGNRRGRRRTYVNLMTVMVLGGLWHGAAWTFVLWGVWHGLWLALERVAAERAGARAAKTSGAGSPGGHGGRHPATVLGTLYTLLIVLAGWVLFRAPDLSVADGMARAMLGFGGAGLSADMAWRIDGVGLTALIAGWLLVFAPLVPWARRRRAAADDPARVGIGAAGTAATVPAGAGGGVGLLAEAGIAAVFLLGIIKLVAESYSPFLYFQF
jgi:alginate O-acetyltransferase complex protein AlgI